MTTCPDRTALWAKSRWTVLAAMTAGLVLSGFAHGGDVSVHSSGRYYQDATGKPLFLIGYYDWASLVDGYFIDHASRYADMMTRGSPYKINYIRIGLQGNRMTASTSPPSWNGVPTPVSVLYVNGKADLDQWDPVFWDGLRAQCTLAKQLGFIVNLSFFDGVSTRPGPSWGYSNSWWNPANQVRTFYPDPDIDHNGGIDQVGELYQTSAFNNNTGIGYYQRRHIDKAIAETAGFDNIIFEVGNELGADSAWNSAVISYIKARTNKVVTQGGNDNTVGVIGAGVQGWSQHYATTVNQFKTSVANIVGHGYPAWEDPDNNEWSCTFGYCSCGSSCSAAWAAQDTGCRQAAWYSFVGGAPAFGGFSIDFWDWWNPAARGFSTTLGDYCKNLESFIQDSGVQFWNMVPSHSLVSNGSTTNSCLTDVGLVAQSSVEYVVYALNDASVTVDLRGLSGASNYRLYDPRTNTWGDPQIVSGGAVRTFSKPAGTDDWVIYIGNGGPAQRCPSQASSTLGTQQTLGVGITPAVATDSQGNVHVIYVSGSAVQYKKYDPVLTLLATETIAAPNGAYYPHIMCDSSDVPHVVFTNATIDYANYCYYTNRIGGSWKTPIVTFTAGSGNSLWYPRLGLWNGYAYIGFQYGSGEVGLAGKILRLTSLSTTPTVDSTVTTATRSGIAVNGNGHVFAIGRNGAAGTYCQEYDSNLNPVGALFSVMCGYPGGSQAAWADKNNIVHFVAWSIQAGGPVPCRDRCGMTYNNTSRRNPDGSYQSCIQGLLGGPYGTGPDGFDTSNSGFWNDDVAPVITGDAFGKIYIAWRGWTGVGEGRITTVDNSGFTQTCVLNTICNDGTNICTGTEFTPAIARRRWWNCEIAPAISGGVYVAWEYAGLSYIRPFGVQSTTEVSIGMGSLDSVNGLTNPQNADGNTTPATIGARDCHRNVNPSVDGYMYFAVSDAWAFQGNKPDVYILVDYYDTGTGALALQYDSIGPADIPHEYAVGGSVTLTNTETWKTKSFHVTDAYFGNRENAGADFRIGGGGTPFFLDVVRVTTQAPVPPIIAAVTPNPQFTYAGVPYILKPTLMQGYPAPTWSLLQGPAGATVEPACGLLSGWTPPVGGLGCYAFSLQASNFVGSYDTSWTVCVLSTKDLDKDGDVDQSDFGFFQNCLSSDPAAPACSPADLNGDGYVDEADLILFLPCMAGANLTPGC